MYNKHLNSFFSWCTQRVVQYLTQSEIKPPRSPQKFYSCSRSRTPIEGLTQQHLLSVSPINGPMPKRCGTKLHRNPRNDILFDFFNKCRFNQSSIPITKIISNFFFLDRKKIIITNIYVHHMKENYIFLSSIISQEKLELYRKIYIIV